MFGLRRRIGLQPIREKFCVQLGSVLTSEWQGYMNIEAEHLIEANIFPKLHTAQLGGLHVPAELKYCLAVNT